MDGPEARGALQRPGDADPLAVARLGVEADKDERLMLSAEDEYAILPTIARASARCASCEVEFEVGSTKCTCGAAPGRCSPC